MKEEIDQEITSKFREIIIKPRNRSNYIDFQFLG